ncbi:hypothetical protein HaLaN_10752 [Haematococcus lacustris]|uniref:Uncharacterized protein n=1 Tax=Haematococcus lacustris TaxID=44745 RepID=A0A699Z716_HAELA|nr:hypothetical protein HaLaN_10752 [Haematococcus lacustris]
MTAQEGGTHYCAAAGWVLGGLSRTRLYPRPGYFLPLAGSTPCSGTSTAPVGATCSPHCAACSALHCSPCPATCLAVVLALPWQPCPCPWWAGWAQLPLAQP